MSATVRQPQAQVARSSRRQENRRRVITVAAAVVAGLAGWIVAGPLLGVPLRVRVTPSAPAIEVAASSVAIVSLLAGLAGWGLLMLVRRFAANQRKIWAMGAVVVLLVSLAGPLGGVRPSTVVALICLHVLVGTVLIVGFLRSVTR
jgi:hypothetical protein